MILDTTLIEQLLMDRTQKTTRIEAATGVRRSAISDYRLGRKNFDNMTLATLVKLQSYINDTGYQKEK